MDRFNYLHSLLEGPAADAVSGLSLTSVNYTEAIAILQRRFGNKQQIIGRHMDQLLAMEPVTSIRDLKGLQRHYDRIEANVRSLKALEVLSESYGSLVSSVLMKRLPKELCVVISKQISDEFWDLDKLMKILENEIEARERADIVVDNDCQTNRRSVVQPHQH